MYWLNRIKKRVERAWMDGRHLDVRPFYDPEIESRLTEVIMTSGLTLDILSRTLFYIRTTQSSKNTVETSSEVIMCKLYDRTSCRIIINSIKALELLVNNVSFKFCIFLYNFFRILFYGLDCQNIIAEN